ncbi:hypothetical protein HPP92_024261 [Vanilla planifolia]|uniref:Uncharacterized protein n=1 Tax=Vanilla planifolia TaxID=51239 RepID=A0A835PKJ0_VANPL|nr:hypothetical protein HPP92_024261 [Vanilla planifolia]
MQQLGEVMLRAATRRRLERPLAVLAAFLPLAATAGTLGWGRVIAWPSSVSGRKQRQRRTRGMSEWWAVDGEMHEIGDHVPPQRAFCHPQRQHSQPPAQADERAVHAQHSPRAQGICLARKAIPLDQVVEEVITGEGGEFEGSTIGGWRL